MCSILHVSQVGLDTTEEDEQGTEWGTAQWECSNSNADLVVQEEEPCGVDPLRGTVTFGRVLQPACGDLPGREPQEQAPLLLPSEALSCLL